MNVLAPAHSAGGSGEEEPLPVAGEASQLLALHEAAHLGHLPGPLLTPGCLSLAPHVVRQVPGVGSVGPNQLSLAHPREGGVTHVTARACTLDTQYTPLFTIIEILFWVFHICRLALASQIFI